MERFYPKNFAMWRPELLLLLIFLEVIYDSTGLLKGVQASKHWHKTHCTDDSHCPKDLSVCDLARNECICRNNFKKARIRAMYAAIYDAKRDACVSLVNKVCTVDDDPYLDKIQCVPNAYCAPQPNLRLADVFGLCKCESGFQETDRHICVPAPVITFPSNEGISSMAQVGALPDEENMVHSSSGDSNGQSADLKPGSSSSGIGRPPYTSEVKDPNSDLDLQTYQDIVDRYKKTNVPRNGGHSNYVHINVCFLPLVSIALISFWR